MILVVMIFIFIFVIQIFGLIGKLELLKDDEKFILCIMFNGG